MADVALTAPCSAPSVATGPAIDEESIAPVDAVPAAKVVAASAATATPDAAIIAPAPVFNTPVARLDAATAPPAGARETCTERRLLDSERSVRPDVTSGGASAGSVPGTSATAAARSSRTARATRAACVASMVPIGAPFVAAAADGDGR